MKKGDVVALKSGGPSAGMVVQDVGDYVAQGGTENSAYCTWMDKNDKPQEGYYDVDTLVPYVPIKSVVLGVTAGKSGGIIRR